MPRWLTALLDRPVRLAAAALILSLFLCGCRRETKIASLPVPFESDAGSETDDDAMWKKVLTPRKLVFPQDHAAHPEYRIEWWYYTGNLESKDGRRFGYQLTFFRTGLQRESRNPSRWAVRDLYTAHFAISDVENKRFLRFERTNRAGVDWAGANEAGRIWNGDWQMQIDFDTQQQTLRAEQENNSIELTLEPEKPLVPHGEQGMSRKGASPGNASYYYSYTRLRTRGQVTIDGQPFAVQGQSWMDHEFSSSFLEKGQQGWDWFSIQFDDGSELMLYQMRLSDGSADSHSSGTWVSADGQTRHLARSAFQLKPSGEWKSPTTGARYPTSWRVQVSELDLNVRVSAVMPNQEMDTSASTGIIYWEGCIDVEGTRAGEVTTGRGYLEMTGYTGRGLGEMIN